MELIYLLEDDDSIRKLVIYALQSQGFDAEGFEAPELFYAAMERKTPALVLLDIMLPGEDGISILKKLRQKDNRLPVIMLTAKNTEFDKVEGLDAGADDYISKPFGIMELIARIRAVLRRSFRETENQEITAGELKIYPERHEVYANGGKVVLTYKEFMLLLLLAENKGNVLTRDTLLEEIWGLGTDRENRTLDVHIRSLRAKLGPLGDYIETVRSVGYRLKKIQDS